MARKRQSKRKISEDEDYDSDSDFEVEKETPRNRNAKRKKVHVESESEGESIKSVENVQNEDEKFQSDDDDEPLIKFGDTLKQREKLEEINTSDSSDDEPLATKRKSSDHSKITGKSKNLSSESDENEFELDDDDDDKPLIRLGDSLKQKEKLEMTNISSASSDDEPLATKRKSSDHSKITGKSKNLSSESDENEFEVDDDDDDKPLIRLGDSLKQKEKLEMTNISSASSDDEPLATKRKSSDHSKITGRSKSLSSESDENRIQESDDESIKKMVKTSKLREITKNAVNSSDSSDDEPLSAKMKNFSDFKHDKHKTSMPEEDKLDVTSDDTEKNIQIKTSKFPGKRKSNRISLSSDGSDSDNSGTTENNRASNVNNINSEIELEENGHTSTDENEPLSNLSVKSSNRSTKKKDQSSTNNKIEHLKKYLRLSGIHINSYDKLFEGCKSIKAKTEKLLSILHEKGMKGRPTIEKCKKLRKKIETKKEVAELDVSNILTTEGGRPKRGANCANRKVTKVQNSPAEKRFSRLKDIIDSEESD